MCKFDHGHGPLITHTGFRYGSWCTRKQPVKRLTKHPFIQGGPIKNVTFYFCPYLCQLLTDFLNSFT